MAIGQPTIQSGLRKDESYLVRRIEDLERVVKQMMAASSIEAATISRGGLTIRDGGGIKVIDPNSGARTVYAGSLPNSAAVPSAQMAFVLRRDDASAALALGDFGSTPGHAHQQALQWYDRAGNIVLADDTVGGVGLARPHLPGPALVNTNIASWPGTANTAFTSIANGYMEAQQPRLSWIITLYAPAGVTAQFALFVAGTQVDATQTVTGGGSGAFASWAAIAAMPVAAVYGSDVLIDLQARVTAGTGTCLAAALQIKGQQS